MPSTQSLSHTPPSARQIALLRRLAASRGTTFVMPKSGRHASTQLDHLLNQRPIDKPERDDARRERRNIAAEMSAGYGTAPADDELEGWGSSARWRTTW